MDQQATPQQHTTIVVVGENKSVGLAFFLAFLFGPLGLLYVTILGGLLMLVIGVISFVILPVIGGIISWIICMIWAVIGAGMANSKPPQVR